MNRYKSNFLCHPYVSDMQHISSLFLCLVLIYTYKETLGSLTANVDEYQLIVGVYSIS